MAAHDTVLISKGKTKVVTQAPDASNEVDVFETDRMTAGNGKRDEDVPHKGEYVTQVNEHATSLLRRVGIPVAFIRRTGPHTRRDIKCSMLPYEVVMTRQVSKPSSIRKRLPHLAVGDRFNEPKVTFFLKTKDRQFGHHRLPTDDPVIVSTGKGGALVCRPDMPEGDGNPSIHIGAELLFMGGPMHPFEAMKSLGIRIFLAIEYGWAVQGWNFLDLKCEFGFGPSGELLLGDTVDPDSWRLFNERGEHRDKQPFREDASVEEMSAIYREIAERVVQFDMLDAAAVPRG